MPGDSHAFWWSVVQMVSEVVVVLDHAGLVQLSNRPGTVRAGEAAAGELQLDPDELRGLIEAALASDAMLDRDLAGRGGEAPRVYRARARRANDPQGRTCVVVSLTDLTAERHTRDELRQAIAELQTSRNQMIQAQKMESVGRLAGGVAHDFNNLLTSIISFTRFVLDDLGQGDPRRSDLVEVLKAADSAARLTNQLLAFSRRRPMEPIHIDLNAALGHIDKVLRRTMGENVELVILPSDADCTVLMDPAQLDQVLMNLAINARDAMNGAGTLTIQLDETRVRKRPGLPDGRYARICVSDSGPGIPEDVIERVFEPFFSTKGGQGTGLGLATVYGIVKQSGGEIEVSSAPPAGTTFTILVPIAKGQPRQRRVSSSRERVTRLQGGVALVVEDQPAILRTMQRSLERAGLSVLSACTAEEALALVQELKANLSLLVTDVVLPGLSGIKLVERLRAQQPELPVIVCSGYMGERDAPVITVDDLTSFLPKPFTGQQLATKAAALLGSSSDADRRADGAASRPPGGS